MAEILAEWGGAQRRLALTFGNLLDIEEACGKVGIGEIYVRLGAHRYYARDVYHVIRQGLIGGGLKPTEADRLLQDRFSAMPMVRNVEIALELLIAVMAGIDADEDATPGDPSKPFDAGVIFASFVKMGIPTQAVRDMELADFVRLCRGLSSEGTKPPSEAEFEEMIARMEARERTASDA
ncbi:gene transfer agent family protein [Arenibacterium halophilum]|nr:gene transfer agent family protein [Arenibacterium halophilum]